MLARSLQAYKLPGNCHFWWQKRKEESAMLLVRTPCISSILCHTCISKRTPPPVQEQALSAHCINYYGQNRSTHPKVVAKEKEDTFILKRFSMDDSWKGNKTSSKAQGTKAVSIILWIIFFWSMPTVCCGGSSKTQQWSAVGSTLNTPPSLRSVLSNSVSALTTFHSGTQHKRRRGKF